MTHTHNKKRPCIVITTELIERTLLKIKDIPIWKIDEDYAIRQVYAAFAKTPLETCIKCPYYFSFKGGGKNQYGQPGICYYCREQSKRHNMTGDALCTLTQDELQVFLD